MLANWIKQNVTTVGIGAIILSTPKDGFTGISNAYSDGDKIFYSLVDGNNRESGIGTYISASNTITRDTIFETIIDGIYSNNTPSAIYLSGTALLMVTPTTQSLTTHIPVWKDTVGIITAPNTAGTAVITGGVTSFVFDSTVEESIGVIFNIGHDIDVGSYLYPLIHWSPSDATVGTVRWGIEYTMATPNTQTFNSSSTIYLEDAAQEIDSRHQIVEVNDINKIAAPIPDTLIIARIFRDATHTNDTYGADAYFHLAKLHYQSTYLGTPNKTSDYYTW